MTKNFHPSKNGVGLLGHLSWIYHIVLQKKISLQQVQIVQDSGAVKWTRYTGIRHDCIKTSCGIPIRTADSHSRGNLENLTNKHHKKTVKVQVKDTKNDT